MLRSAHCQLLDRPLWLGERAGGEASGLWAPQVTGGEGTLGDAELLHITVHGNLGAAPGWLPEKEQHLLPHFPALRGLGSGSPTSCMA